MPKKITSKKTAAPLPPVEEAKPKLMAEPAPPVPATSRPRKTITLYPEEAKKTAKKATPAPPPEEAASEAVLLRSYKKTALGFVGLALALLLAIVYVSFSSATVIVTVRATDAQAEAISEVRSEPASGEVAGEVKSAVLDGEKTQEVAGVEHDVPAQAFGTVRIINEISRVQPLVATTRLLSPEGVLFRLKNKVTVPGKGEVAVEVYADQPGAPGNLNPTRFTIPGLNPELQKSIYAVSEAPMTGGLVKKVGVGQSDVDAAVEEIKKTLLSDGIAELKKQWKEGLGNAELYKTDLIEVTADPKPGSDAKAVKVRAKIRVTGVHFDRETLLQLAESKLKERARGEEEVSSIDREGFGMEISSADPAAGTATVRGTIKGKISISGKSPILDPEQLVGLTRRSAEDYLRGFHAVRDVKVRVRPFWLRRLPNLRDRINIKVITE